MTHNFDCAPYFCTICDIFFFSLFYQILVERETIAECDRHFEKNFGRLVFSVEFEK